MFEALSSTPNFETLEKQSLTAVHIPQITSNGNLPLHSRFAGKTVRQESQASRWFAPIAPNANQYSTIVLELADDATMTKDSWVKMGKCYDVPLRVVRPYKSSDLLCQLTPESCRAVRDFIESNPPGRD